jgi:CSLREA domain-containing protein
MRTFSRLLVVAALLAGSFALTPAAQAATIAVNTTADELNTDGDCSLREALASANSDGVDPHDACTAGSGADTIALPAGTYTRTEFTILPVTSPITVDPTGVVVIDGNMNPLFSVSPAGDLTLSDLTLRRGNTMGGGGVFNQGTAVLQGVTMEANTTSIEGGGVANHGTLTVRNSTFSGNQTTGGGGGLLNAGTATLNNVTFSDNVADSDTDGTGDGGGIRVDSGTVTIENTLLGGNTDKSTGADPNHPDCSGTLTSGGYNLIQSTTGCTITGTATGNITGKNPQLVGLADNDGPTPTRAIRRGSPAVDAGNPAAPGSSPTACEPRDQRGVKRPQGPRCDIGSFERERPSEVECLGRPVTTTGTSGSDVLTGTVKRDVIRALGGDDVVDALGGNDRVCAGAGNDRVNGRTGNDQGTGGSGNDRLIGAAGGDTLSGQGGRDRLKGKRGDDSLRGGPKPDNLNGGGGIDTCRGGGGRDRIRRCES